MFNLFPSSHVLSFSIRSVIPSPFPLFILSFLSLSLSSALGFLLSFCPLHPYFSSFPFQFIHYLPFFYFFIPFPLSFLVCIPSFHFHYPFYSFIILLFLCLLIPSLSPLLLSPSLSSLYSLPLLIFPFFFFSIPSVHYPLFSFIILLFICFLIPSLSLLLLSPSPLFVFILSYSWSLLSSSSFHRFTIIILSVPSSFFSSCAS